MCIYGRSPARIAALQRVAIYGERPAIEHKPMYMNDYVEQLDSILSSGNRKLLKNSGSISHSQAVEKAKTLHFQ